MPWKRAVSIGVLCGLVGLAGGCAAKSSREVSGSELVAVQNSVRNMRVGMTKDDAIAAMPDVGYKNLVGTTEIEGGVLEEWTLQAYTADYGFGSTRYGQPVETFERYFYFVNNKLADMSAEPLEYRDRRDLIIEWRDR